MWVYMDYLNYLYGFGGFGGNGKIILFFLCYVYPWLRAGIHTGTGI